MSIILKNYPPQPSILKNANDILDKRIAVHVNDQLVINCTTAAAPRAMFKVCDMKILSYISFLTKKVEF